MHPQAPFSFTTCSPSHSPPMAISSTNSITSPSLHSHGAKTESEILVSYWRSHRPWFGNETHHDRLCVGVIGRYAVDKGRTAVMESLVCLWGITRWCLLLPNLLRHYTHDFPSLEFYKNAVVNKNIPRGIWGIITDQMLFANPVTRNWIYRTRMVRISVFTCGNRRLIPLPQSLRFTSIAGNRSLSLPAYRKPAQLHVSIARVRNDIHLFISRGDHDFFGKKSGRNLKTTIN